MNNKLWLIVASYCFIVFPLWGDDVLPASLPVGNQLLDMAVTASPCSVIIAVQSVTPQGGLTTCGVAVNQSFSSYSDLQSYVASDAFRRFNILGGQNNGNDIRFVATVTSIGMNTSGVMITNIVFAVDTDLGPAENVTQSLFYINQTLQSFVVPISGITSASVQFGTSAYTPLLLAGTNGIVLNNSFLTNSDKLRIKITLSDGQTAIYTQYGNLITPPNMNMFWLPAPPDYDDWDAWDMWEWQYGQYMEDYWGYGYGYATCNSYNIVVSASTYGVDTVVESTTDFISWTPIGNIPWDSWWWGQSIIIPVDTQNTSVPQMFFRSFSQ